jgi:DNA modification methylase
MPFLIPPKSTKLFLHSSSNSSKVVFMNRSPFISDAFGKNNCGAIPSSLLSIPNTESNSNYLRICKELGIERHPARFPSELPAFFIKMLTDEGDIVLDIFGSSNTTGFTAEALRRKWITFEINKDYLSSSAFRFLDGEFFHHQAEPCLGLFV